MADLAKYVVALEAETGRYRRELQRANQKLDRFGRDQRKTLRKVDAGFSGLARSVGTFKASLAALGVGLAVRGFTRLSDEVATFDARLKSALGGNAASSFRNDLIEIANVTGQSLKSVVDLFQQTSRLREVLQATDDDFRQFTENVFKLGIIGGSSTEEVANGLRQLRQALASSRVQAEEINSIIEQTPEIAAAIEDSLGLMPGTLKSAVKEGRVLNKDVFQGILDKTDEIQEKFENFPSLFSQAFNRIGNETNLLLAAIGEALGLTGSSDSFLGSIAKDIQELRIALEDYNRAKETGGFANDIVIDRGAPAVQIFSDQELFGESLESVEAMFAALHDLSTEYNRTRLEDERALMDLIAEMEIANLEAINDERERFGDMFADNLIQAAEGGFDEVLKGWIRTLQQMVARAAATELFGALFPKGLFTDGGFFSGIGQALGFRASGGAVMGGAPYVVGERGPELFVPSGSGSVIPNNALGGNVTVVQNFTVGDVATRSQLLSISALTEERTKAAVFETLRRGRPV